MALDIAGGARALAGAARRDLVLGADDGADIAVRVTEAIGPSKAVVVYHNGTAGTGPMFDGMADALARRGITSYAVTSRTHLDEAGKVLPDPGFDIHAKDFARVADRAALEHPGEPLSAMGASFGQAVVQYYNNTMNRAGHRVIGLSPVVLDRFLPFGEKVKVVASLASDRFSRTLVSTPMSRQKQMTSNPASDYVTKEAEMRQKRVPARLFRDVFRMHIGSILNRGSAGGTVHTIYAGADAVGVNASAKPVVHLQTPKDRRAAPLEIDGAPHELSQEWNDPRVVDAIAGIALLPR